jgi:hypothetical protein
MRNVLSGAQGGGFRPGATGPGVGVTTEPAPLVFLDLAGIVACALVGGVTAKKLVQVTVNADEVVTSPDKPLRVMSPVLAPGGTVTTSFLVVSDTIEASTPPMVT